MQSIRGLTIPRFLLRPLRDCHSLYVRTWKAFPESRRNESRFIAAFFRNSTINSGNGSETRKGDFHMVRTKHISRSHLPALLCRMGDRGFFVTALQFQEIADWVEDTTDMHSSRKLQVWIQQRLENAHARGISQYLLNEESRFFNALVVGVFGGDPEWAPLNVADPRKELSAIDESRINETVGILVLTGKEKLFPIDGQHRVAGIKKAVEDMPDLGEEEVAVILVGHAQSDVGMTRTRRLFVTLNQRAKRVSDRDIVALDEDNGFAVVTRQIVDDGTLFTDEDLVAFSGSVAIPDANTTAITSILGLYHIIKALYPKNKDYRPRYAVVGRTRPEDRVIDKMRDHVVKYWKALIATIPEYRTVMKSGKTRPGEFRSKKTNHLLFRPAGQRAMAKATECLVSQGMELEEAVKILTKGSPMSLFERVWHSVLWDPATRKMLNNAGLAETVLLNGAGHEARTEEAQRKLNEVRKRRGDELED